MTEDLKSGQRYDLATKYRAGSYIEEMEPADDGEWVRWDTLLEVRDRIKLEHHEWDDKRVAELQALRASLTSYAEAAQQIAEDIRTYDQGDGNAPPAVRQRWVEAILALGQQKPE